MTRILLVEDDAWLAETEAAMFERAGYEVTIAPHGFAAIEYIDVVVPDVIILDVLLTGATGFALLNELQSHADTKAVPVILCTNLAEQVSRVNLEQYGVMRVVDKTTMHPDDLLAAVRSVVAQGDSYEDDPN